MLDNTLIYDKILSLKLNTSLSRVVEGTGPMIPGNLFLQGAKSGGLGLSER